MSVKDVVGCVKKAVSLEYAHCTGAEQIWKENQGQACRVQIYLECPLCDGL